MIGQAMAEIMTTDHTWDLQGFEMLFRALNSPIYLLAAPVGPQQENQVPTDFRDGAKKTYWLWISVNGKPEAEATMCEFGIPSYQDNFERLADTGFLVTEEAT